MMTELDIFNQLHYAREDGFAEGLTEGLAKGEAKGKAEGLAEGKAEGKAEIIKTMLNNHVPVEQICLYTGISESEIDKLIESY